MLTIIGAACHGWVTTWRTSVHDALGAINQDGGNRRSDTSAADLHTLSGFLWVHWARREAFELLSCREEVQRLTGETWRGPLSCTSKDHCLCLTCPNRFSTFEHRPHSRFVLWTNTTLLTLANKLFFISYSECSTKANKLLFKIKNAVYTYDDNLPFSMVQPT